MKRLLVGVGHAGIDIVENISDELGLPTMAVDLDRYCVHQAHADYSVFVNEGKVKDSSNLRIDNEFHIDNINDIQEIFEKYDVVYLISALGGRAGGVVFPAIAKEAIRLGKRVKPKVILPFEIESTRREIAEIFLENIEELFDEIDVYDNNEYVKKAEREVTLDSIYSINSLFEEINRDVLREIQKDLMDEETGRRKRSPGNL